MEQLFRGIVEISFQATIVGAVLLIAINGIKKQMPPKWQYILWGILLIKLVIPYGPESNWSLFNFIPSQVDVAANSHLEEDVEERNINTNNGTITEGYIDQTAESTDLDRSVNANNSDLADNVQIVNTSIDVKSDQVQGMNGIVENHQISSDKVSARVVNWKVLLLPIIWSVGFVVTAMSIVVSYLCFRSKLRSKAGQAPEVLEQLLNDAKKQMNMKQEIDIKVIEGGCSPALIGGIKPTIVFPRTFIHLESTEIYYMILHELAHYKRRDHWVNQGLIFFQCVHWFNPFLRMYFRKIRQVMELCADEQVVAKLEDKQHKIYAKTLLKVLESTQEKLPIQGALALADNKKEMKVRLESIAHFKKYKKTIIALGIILITVLSICLLTSKKNDINWIQNKEAIGESAVNKQEDLAGQQDSQKDIYEEDTYKGDIASEVENLWETLTKLSSDQDSQIWHILRNTHYRNIWHSFVISNEPDGKHVHVTYDDTYFLPEREDSWKIGIPTTYEEHQFYGTALMLLALVEDVQSVRYEMRTTVPGESDGKDKESYTLLYTREGINQYLGKDVLSYGEDIEVLIELLKKIDLMIMGNESLDYQDIHKQLGIRLLNGMSDSEYYVLWETENGTFVGDTSYKQDQMVYEEHYSNKGKRFRTLTNQAAYWSPIQEDGTVWDGESNVVTATFIDHKGNTIGVVTQEVIYNGEVYRLTNELPVDARGSEWADAQGEFRDVQIVEGKVTQLYGLKNADSFFEVRNGDYKYVKRWNTSELNRFGIKEGDQIKIAVKEMGNQRYIIYAE